MENEIKIGQTSLAKIELFTIISETLNDSGITDNVVPPEIVEEAAKRIFKLLSEK